MVLNRVFLALKVMPTAPHAESIIFEVCFEVYLKFFWHLIGISSEKSDGMHQNSFGSKKLYLFGVKCPCQSNVLMRLRATDQENKTDTGFRELSFFSTSGYSLISILSWQYHGTLADVQMWFHLHVVNPQVEGTSQNAFTVVCFLVELACVIL